jgi:hypothetical protein
MRLWLRVGRRPAVAVVVGEGTVQRPTLEEVLVAARTLAAELGCRLPRGPSGVGVSLNGRNPLVPEDDDNNEATALPRDVREGDVVWRAQGPV